MNQEEKRNPIVDQEGISDQPKSLGKVKTPVGLISHKKLILGIMASFLVIAIGVVVYWWPSEKRSLFCGGFAGASCPPGFICQPEGKYPDAGGQCVSIFKYFMLKINRPGEKIGVTPTSKPALIFTPTPTPLEFSEKPAETVDWETYTNEKFKFTLKYPKERYRIEEDNEEIYSQRYNAKLADEFIKLMGYLPPKEAGAIGVYQLEPKTFPLSDQDHFSIWIFGNPEELTLNDWYEKYRFYPFRFGQMAPYLLEQERPKQSIIVSGIEGKTMTDSVPDVGERRYVYLAKNSYIFLIKIFLGKGEGERILSTFKFSENALSPVSAEDYVEEKSAEGKFCGGFAGIPCPTSYRCVLEGSYPDAGGKCVRE